MPSTSPDGLRYPTDLDTPDVPRDIMNLANDTQAALTAKFLYGPVGDVPDTLAPGQVYYGYL